ncbi:MAG: hypothetical protein GY757_32175 [bacterium]|nr:hypothetical protein [bacterium]
MKKRVFLSGQNGCWLSIGRDNKILRGDDGTFLMNQNKHGKFSPILPPKPESKGKLEIIKPSSLITRDGAVTHFQITLKNTGRAPVYWCSVTHDLKREQKKRTPKKRAPGTMLPVFLTTQPEPVTMPLPVFHPPPNKSILKPGETAVMECGVSIRSLNKNPYAGETTLFLKINTAFLRPVKLDIPVNFRVPCLTLVKVQLEEAKRILHVTIKNTGMQALLTDTEITARLGKRIVGKVTRKQIHTNESVLLSFAIPKEITIDRHSPVSIHVDKLGFPHHTWELEWKPVNRGVSHSGITYWYLVIAAVVVLLFLVVYILRRKSD